VLGPIVPLPFYAPAFVGFIGGPSFSVSIGMGAGIGVPAWFPLGPGEPFFPWYHYGGDYLRVVNITNIRNVTNITNIINVRNINEIHYAYKTVGATVVREYAFRSGMRVADIMVRVPPEALERVRAGAPMYTTRKPTRGKAGGTDLGSRVRCTRFSHWAGSRASKTQIDSVAMQV
jgi:hypothetical protein